MKIILSLLILSSLQLCAAFSQLHVIKPTEKDDEHRKFIPKIEVCTKNPNTLIVTVPFFEGFKEYWIVTSTQKLKDNQLEFRNFIWDVYDKPTPPYISSMVPLGQSFDYWERPPKALGHAMFRIHKSLIDKTYIYYDFAASVLDGGYYYAIPLSGIKVE
jgi:hypothetical protein